MRINIKCRHCKKEFIENSDRLFLEYTADSDTGDYAETRCPHCKKNIRVRVNFWTEQ